VVDAAGRALADLPERFGPYQTAKRRYYRWVEQGVIDRIFAAVSDDPDIEWLAIDATVIRAQGGEPVIPPRRHRKVARHYDTIAYKQRWVRTLRLS
jgi:transposase